jgi:hypothetical protein
MSFFNEDDTDVPRRRTRRLHELDDDEVKSSRRLRRRYEEEEDEEEDVLEQDPQEELVELLENIERHRERLGYNIGGLRALLRRNPLLEKQWNSFLRSGGVTANDLECFLNGQFRPRLTRTRKHLRLVSNREPSRIRMRRQSEEPDDAA